VDNVLHGMKKSERSSVYGYRVRPTAHRVVATGMLFPEDRGKGSGPGLNGSGAADWTSTRDARYEDEDNSTRSAYDTTGVTKKELELVMRSRERIWRTSDWWRERERNRELRRSGGGQGQRSSVMRGGTVREGHLEHRATLTNRPDNHTSVDGVDADGNLSLGGGDGGGGGVLGNDGKRDGTGNANTSNANPTTITTTANITTIKNNIGTGSGTARSVSVTSLGPGRSVATPSGATPSGTLASINERAKKGADASLHRVQASIHADRVRLRKMKDSDRGGTGNYGDRGGRAVDPKGPVGGLDDVLDGAMLAPKEGPARYKVIKLRDYTYDRIRFSHNGNLEGMMRKSKPLRHIIQIFLRLAEVRDEREKAAVEAAAAAAREREQSSSAGVSNPNPNDDDEVDDEDEEEEKPEEVLVEPHVKRVNFTRMGRAAGWKFSDVTYTHFTRGYGASPATGLTFAQFSRAVESLGYQQRPQITSFADIASHLGVAVFGAKPKDPFGM
jgi:hypothetical protein